MHEASYAFVESQLALNAGAAVLDVGSYDVNGSLRQLIEARGGGYTGIDTRAGPNVDVVTESPYRYPFFDNTFDVVIAANMLHNVEKPWRLIPELARILRPKGMLIVATVYQWGRNSHPIDYFRYMDSGLRSLFDESGQLIDYYACMDEHGNTFGTAKKRE